MCSTQDSLLQFSWRLFLALFIVVSLIVPIVLDMDSDFPGNLIVNPSDVKVEPLSPQPTHEQLLDIQTELKSEPDIVIKEEPGNFMPKPSTVQTSVLKQPTILISSRPSSASNTRVLYPKPPVKVESDATGWRLSPAKFLVNGNQSPHSISSISSSSLSHIKSSSRRAIDSHLISSNTVRKQSNLRLQSPHLVQLGNGRFFTKPVSFVLLI